MDLTIGCTVRFKFGTFNEADGIVLSIDWQSGNVVVRDPNSRHTVTIKIHEIMYIKSPSMDQLPMGQQQQRTARSTAQAAGQGQPDLSKVSSPPIYTGIGHSASQPIIMDEVCQIVKDYNQNPRTVAMPDHERKCECGSHKVGSDKHSDYCPLYLIIA